MEQINSIELKDESIYPDETVLKRVLEDSYLVLTEILTLFDQYGMKYDWKYYKDGKAWLCKVEKKSKTIVWMSAWAGYMKATIYFPERYMDDLMKLDISEGMKDAIRTAKNVGKSKPCMFEIRKNFVLNDFETIMKLKLQQK